MVAVRSTFAAPGDLVGTDVEHQVPHHQLVRVLRSHPGALDQPVQADQDLLQRERLGDVVVRAGSEAADPVVHRVPGGEEQRRHIGTKGADLLQHLKPVQFVTSSPITNVRWENGRLDGGGPAWARFTSQPHRDRPM